MYNIISTLLAIKRETFDNFGKRRPILMLLQTYSIQKYCKSVELQIMCTKQGC